MDKLISLRPPGPDGQAGGAGPHQPVHRQPAPLRQGERPRGHVLLVRSGHLHQDPQRLKPAEQRGRVCQVRVK